MIFLGMAIRNAQVNDFIFVSVSTSRGYTAFFTGILLALILKKYKPKIVNYIFSILIVVSVPILLYKYKETYMSVGFNYILTYLFYPALIVLFTSNVKKLFRFKFIGTVGKISMDAFLWHFPVILGFINFNKYFEMGLDYENRWYMIIILIVSYILGTFTYYFIEKPALKILVDKFVHNKEDKELHNDIKKGTL